MKAISFKYNDNADVDGYQGSLNLLKLKVLPYMRLAFLQTDQQYALVEYSSILLRFYEVPSS